MTLEDQVVSLPLAKRLKELGVKQESVFWWGGIGNMGIWCDHVKENMPEREDRFTWVSAFTVAELGMLLPLEVTSTRLEGGMSTISWYVEYDSIPNEKRRGFRNRCFTDEKEADARAKMLVYLIENKLIKL